MNSTGPETRLWAVLNIAMVHRNQHLRLSFIVPGGIMARS